MSFIEENQFFLAEEANLHFLDICTHVLAALSKLLPTEVELTIKYSSDEVEIFLLKMFPQGGTLGTGASKILAWTWTYKSDKFAPKNNNFPQKGNHLPSISERVPRNNFDSPKFVDLPAFY